MVNYVNGKIYKIESTLGDKIYIGSTTKAQLSMRMSKHRSQYNSWKAGKDCNMTSFQIFEEYGLENCKIVLLENCPCETKDQLSAREAHYIKTLTCVNKNIPLRTHKEYREDNREVRLVKKKKYYEANKEVILEKSKEYHKANKEAISAYKKKWSEANRDKINEQKRANRAKKKLEQTQ